MRNNNNNRPLVSLSAGLKRWQRALWRLLISRGQRPMDWGWMGEDERMGRRLWEQKKDENNPRRGNAERPLADKVWQFSERWFTITLHWRSITFTVKEDYSGLIRGSDGPTLSCCGEGVEWWSGRGERQRPSGLDLFILPTWQHFQQKRFSAPWSGGKWNFSWIWVCKNYRWSKHLHTVHVVSKHPL